MLSVFKVRRNYLDFTCMLLMSCIYFLFPQKKVTQENSRLRLPLLLLVLLVGAVLAEPDDASFGRLTTGSA
jgi:hypothetical protein